MRPLHSASVGTTIGMVCVVSRAARALTLFGHDDVGFPSDELRGKGRDPLGSTLRGEVLDDEVLALHVAELAQALGERAPDTRTLGVRERDISQDSQPVDFARLLSLAGQRVREKTCQGSGEEYST